MLVIDLQGPSLDVDLAAVLVPLPQDNDVGHQPGYEVHVGQLSVFTRLADEEDGSAPLNIHHGPVAKFDGFADGAVQLGEGEAGAGHMIGGAGVEDRS